MQKLLLWVIAIIFLILDWAALDDITTGNESNYYMEYATLLSSLVFFSLLCYKIFYKKQKS